MSSFAWAFAAGLPVFRVWFKSESPAAIPNLPEVAERGDAAVVLQDRSEVHEIPTHESRVAVREIVFWPARSFVEIAGTGSDFADPAGVGGGRNRIADVLQAVEQVRRAVLHAVFVAGDDSATDLAIENVLAFVVKFTRVSVEPFDNTFGNRAVVTEPDRSGQHKDVRRLHRRKQGRPGIRWPAVFGHVGVDAGGDVVVDSSNQIDLHSLLSHNPRAEVNDTLGITDFGAAF